MLKRISNETKVGILATIAIVLVILGINFLKGKNIFSRNITLYSYYDQIDGLTSSNPVMLYGMQVGQVDAVELLAEGPHNILVQYHIYGNVKIADNSVAKIVSSDLLGSKALQLVPGDSKQLVVKNDTLTGEVEMSLTESINRVVAPVKGKVENLITSVDTIVTTLNEVFDQDTKTNIRTSFRSIRETLENVEKTSGEVNNFVVNENSKFKSILASFESVAKTLRENEAEIDHAIKNFSAISDSLRAARLQDVITETSQAMTSFNKLLDGIQKGDGSAGKLMKDDQLYNNLKKASENLDKLVIDLKQNPDRYINISLIKFGKKSKAE